MLSGFRPLVALLLVLFYSCVAVEAKSNCLAMGVLQGINFNLFEGFQYDNSSLYFCTSSSPLLYQCKCPILMKCEAKNDPWGQNIGQCVCCRGYVTFLFVVIAMLATTLLIILIYTIFCNGKWWCDGFPSPLRIKMPRRAAAAPCPAGPIVPRNLFQGYRNGHFVDIVEQQQEETGEQLFHSSPHNPPGPPVFEVVNQESLSPR